MRKVYDPHNDRILVLADPSSEAFWDGQWSRLDLERMLASGLRNRFLRRHTQRYLPQGSRILEGGCGMGQNVHALSSWGYEVHGVDYARDTIQRTLDCYPGLKLSVQDVRKMDFPDGFFDGYWSLGVIEHFYDGYGPILAEASRVIRPGGFLFVTFPYISPLRRQKIGRQIYPVFQGDSEPEGFYQFLLNDQTVREDLEAFGFDLVHREPWDATRGLMDETRFWKPFFRSVYNSQGLAARGLRVMNTMLFRWWGSHVILLVLRKKGGPPREQASR